MFTLSQYYVVMRPIVTDGVAWSLCRSVTIVRPAKMTQTIAMPFGLRTKVGQGTTY